MAWSKVGELAFLVTSGTGTETINLPGTPATGDFVLAILAVDQGMAGDGASGGGGLAGSNGYTPIVSGNLLPSYQIAYKVMGGSPDSSVVVDRSTDTARSICGIIQIWRGADASTPIDATATTNSGSTGLPNPPSYTTVTAGALRIIIGLLDDDTAPTTGAPAGYTDFLASATTGTTGNFGATVMVASKEATTPGAEDPAAFTGGVGSDDWSGVHFALRPASGGGGGPVETPQTVSVGASTSVSTSKRGLKRVLVSSVSSLTVVRATGKGVAATGAATVTITKPATLRRTVAVSASSAVSFVRRTGKAIAGALSSTVSVLVSRAFLVGISVAATSAIALAKRPGKIVAAASGAAVSTAKDVDRKIAVVANAAAQIAKGVGFKVSASATSGVGVAKSAGKAFTASVGSAVNVIRDQTAKVFQQSIDIAAVATTALGRQARKGISTTVSGTVASGRAIAKGVSIAASTAVSVPKAIAKKVAGFASATASVVASRGAIVFEQAVNVVATSSVTARKTTLKFLSLTASTLSSGTRLIGKGVAVVPSATVQATKAVAFSVMVGASLTASVPKGIGKTLSASATSLVTVVASQPFVRSAIDQARVVAAMSASRISASFTTLRKVFTTGKRVA